MVKCGKKKIRKVLYSSWAIFVNNGKSSQETVGKAKRKDVCGIMERNKMK